MPTSDPLANLYIHAAQLLQSHEALLADAPRNRPFYRALKKKVSPESSVLDLCAGTGLWAIAAARLGAKRVVAVEQDPALLGLIKALARDNGVADRVETVCGDARQVGLGREFDVVISETIGHLVFDEQIVPIMIHARSNLLKPGGSLIPETVALCAAPAHLPAPRQPLPAGIPICYDTFAALVRNAPLKVDRRQRVKTLGPPRDLIRVALADVAAPPELTDLAAAWPGLDVHAVNGFLVWAEATLAKGVTVTTLPTTSWSPLFYRVQPFQEERGDLEFKLTLAATTNYWTATLVGARQEEMQSYSPAYVAAVFLAAAQAGVEISPQARRSVTPRR